MSALPSLDRLTANPQNQLPVENPCDKLIDFLNSWVTWLSAQPIDEQTKWSMTKIWGLLTNPNRGQITKLDNPFSNIASFTPNQEFQPCQGYKYKIVDGVYGTVSVYLNTMLILQFFDAHRNAVAHTPPYDGTRVRIVPAFHGTSSRNVAAIFKSGFDPTKGMRAIYGRGVYFTNNLKTAQAYAKQSTDGVTGGYPVVIRAYLLILETDEMLNQDRRVPDNQRLYQLEKMRNTTSTFEWIVNDSLSASPACSSLDPAVRDTYFVIKMRTDHILPMEVFETSTQLVRNYGC